MCSRKQSLNPPAERHIFLGKTRGEPCAAVDQQHPQITVAALADALGSLVGIGAASGDDRWKTEAAAHQQARQGYLRMLLIHGARTALPGLAKKDTPLGPWLRLCLREHIATS